MTGKMSLLALPLLAALACGGSKAPVVVVVSMDRVAQESVKLDEGELGEDHVCRCV